MANKKNTGKGGQRKHGRSKRKAQARGTALSRYIRGKISFEQYQKETK
jgi:uncharacterized membrane protein